MKGKRSSSLRNLPAYQRPPAEKIGKYKILGTLGRGGMGIVYKGLDPDIEREVAIKTIRLDTITEGQEKEEMLARVVREAKAAGRLNHPNIITIYDVIRESDLTFIIMQYVDGQSLQALIDSGKRFSPREVIDLLRPVAEALDFAHRNGIVHRDIKPANILLDKVGRPFLADFGVARLEASTMTGPGKTIGTLSYMSPEQVLGNPVDHRADLFALGVILYELLTGKKPFAGDNLSTIVYKIVNEEPPQVTEINHSLPLGYEGVVKKALAKNSGERYQSGRELVDALADPDSFAAATRAYGSGMGEPEKATSKKLRPLVLAGGLAVFVLLAIGGYLILSGGRGGGSGTAAPGLQTLKEGEKSPGTRSEGPSQGPAASPAEEKLAKLKEGLERKDYEGTIRLAEKMLSEDPTNPTARDYLDKARESARAERINGQVASILEAGIASYNNGDLPACVEAMEKVLKLDSNNGAARKYLFQADTALSKQAIQEMLEQHRVAEENKDLPTVLSHFDSPALVSEARRRYKEWFNGYDRITSRIDDDKSFAFADRSNATLSFSQRIYGNDRKDGKKKMVSEGQRIWELKRVAGVWKIVNIR
ncbi:MAG: protein kinase [Candidatus Aminicenantales bacterium]|jgi:serine/threonine-protein kinase